MKPKKHVLRNNQLTNQTTDHQPPTNQPTNPMEKRPIKVTLSQSNKQMKRTVSQQSNKQHCIKISLKHPFPKNKKKTPSPQLASQGHKGVISPEGSKTAMAWHASQVNYRRCGRYSPKKTKKTPWGLGYGSFLLFLLTE